MKKTVLLFVLSGCTSGQVYWLSVFPGHEAGKWTERWTATVRPGPAPVRLICERLKASRAATDELLKALGREVASLAGADELTVSRAAGDFRLALDVLPARGKAELTLALEGGDDVLLSLRGRRFALLVDGNQAGRVELELDRRRRVELRREADIVSVLVDGDEVLRERLVFWDDAPDEVSVRGGEGVAIARISWSARAAPVRAVELAAADGTVLAAMRSPGDESSDARFVDAMALYLRAGEALKNSPLYPRTADGFTVGRHRLAECIYKAGICALRLGRKAEAKEMFSKCVKVELRGPWQERADLELARLAAGTDFRAAMDHVYRIFYERGRRAETAEEACRLAMDLLAQKPDPPEAVFQLKRLNAHIEWLRWPMEQAARFLFKLGEVYELREKPHEAADVWRALQRREYRRFPESAAARTKLGGRFSVDSRAAGR